MHDIPAPLQPRRTKPVVNKDKEPAPVELFCELVDDELMKKYPVRQGNRVYRLTLLEIICDHLTIANAKGSKAALKLMLGLKKDLKNNPSFAPLIIHVHRDMLKVL